MDKPIIIEFERTGGFAGLTLNKTINSNDLPPDEAAKLKELIFNADLTQQETKMTEKAAFPDQFFYRFTVKIGEQVFNYLYQENQLPPSARPLIRYLTLKKRK
jgi:hypothetical protein